MKFYSIALHSGILDAINNTGLILTEMGMVLFCNDTCEHDKGLLQYSMKSIANYSKLKDEVCEILSKNNGEVAAEIWRNKL